MGICFLCTECQRPLNVGQEFAGRQGKCPHCECNLGVPEASQITREEFEVNLKVWLERQAKGNRVVEESPSEELPPTQVGRADTEITGAAALIPSEINVANNQPPVFQRVAAKVVESPTVLSESQKISNDLSTQWLKLNSKHLSFPQAGDWYVRPPSGGQFGPADVSLLRAWIEEGRVTPDSFVWCQGWGDWQLAGEAFTTVNESKSAFVNEAEDSGQVAAVKTRTAYLKARQRRTMRNLIGLITGTIVVVVLIIILIFVIGGRGV